MLGFGLDPAQASFSRRLREFLALQPRISPALGAPPRRTCVGSARPALVSQGQIEPDRRIKNGSPRFDSVSRLRTNPT